MGEPNYGWLIAGLALGWSVLNTAYTWYNNTQSATKRDVDQHGKDISGLQSDIKSLPTKDAFHQLEISVTRLEGQSTAQGKELQAIAATTQRIEKWLLDSSQKSPRGRA